MPVIHKTAFIHPQATVIGSAEIAENVMVSPHASIRGDEGTPLYIGNSSNVQDCVVIHSLETHGEDEKEIEGRMVEVDDNKYAVYVGERVSLAHQSQIHGPSRIGNDTFIAMQALVFNANVGNNCVLEPKSGIVGASVPDNRYIPAGVVITSQEDADKLPEIYEDYPYKNTNKAVVQINIELAEGYHKLFDEQKD